MKKYNFIKFILGVFVFLGLTSCDDRELITIDSKSAPILIDLSSDNLILDSKFPTNQALTITWSAATYSVPVEVKYVVEISSTEDFSNPVRLGATTQSQNYVSYSTVEINEAVKKIGLIPDVSQKMYIRVTSYIGESSLYQQSNVTSLSITPYLASPTYEYTDLYLIGSSSPAAWDNAADNINLIPLLKSSTSTTTYSYTGFLKASGTNGGLKIIQNKGSWDVQYGLGSSAGSLSTDGGSGNIPVPSDGYYKLTINTSGLSYTLESVSAPTTTYTSVSIIGSVNGNWDTDMQLTKSTFDPHLWIGSKLHLTGGEFKFRADNDWAVSWGTNAEFFGTATIGGVNIPLTAEWDYNVYFNDLSGVYTLIPVK